MKIGVAQIRPVTGDIEENIAHHKKLINLAVCEGADMIVFPELSLTGYEPERAQDSAIHQNDKRLEVFQNICNANQVIIGVGIPIKTNEGINISMILFQPHASKLVYSKHYLHADEKPFFISGQNLPVLKVNDTKIGLAICYELSVPQHAAHAFNNGAEIYIASVAKTTDGVEKAINRLSEIANKYAVTVLMSNCIGPCEGKEGGGKTSVWNIKGILAGQLNDSTEGILLIDTNTQELVEKTI